MTEEAVLSWEEEAKKETEKQSLIQTGKEPQKAQKTRKAILKQILEGLKSKCHLRMQVV